MSRALAVFVVLVGCDVGEYEGPPPPGAPMPPGGGGGTSPDASDVEPPPAPDAAPAAEPIPIPCEEPDPTPSGGEHNAGQACIVCHAAEEEAPLFTIAGTLFASPSEDAPKVGATIVVLDAMGVERKLVTRTDGSFWSTQGYVFPVQVMATSCPDARPMIAPVDAAGGDCNSCHDAALRMTLP